MRRAILVAFIFAMALIPHVNASGGVIEAISISGNEEIGEGPISLNITMVGVGGASSASVNWNVTLTDENGSIIDYDNGNVLINDGVYSYVETTVSNAPLGYSNLSVVITGDVGTPSQGQYTNYSTMIQRLRPLEISLAEPTINPVDENGNYTGNFTVNDGDFAVIEVPIINSGDVPWNGSLNLSLDSFNLGEQFVNISGDSTVIMTYTTPRLQEGIHFVNVSLNGTQDTDSSDDSYQTTFIVGPPPLPVIELSLERITQPEPGNAMNWVLHANNTGESNFSGILSCDIDGQDFFSSEANISKDGYSNYTVSMNSKPGHVVCTTTGARTYLTINATDLVEMTSAIFVGAGHSTPSILGGPWHAGDDITLSLLLRNEGDAIGTSHLEIEIGGIVQEGPPISLDSGKAGEVTHSFSVASSGDKMVNWSIVSGDGVVDSNLSGSIPLPVLDSQVIVFEIESVDVEDEGVVISWSAELSEGKDRLVNLKFGAIQDGLKGVGIVEERLLLPGITYGSVNIGFQDGQEVYIDLSEIGWTIGFSSFTDDEAQMPSFEINPQITVNPNTQPRVPSVGSKVTVYYTLTNIATGTVPQGQIVVTDASGEILGSGTSPEVTSGSIDHSTVVSWPSGENVRVSVSWYVAGKSVSDDVLVNSEKIESEADDFEIPWGGILGGLTLGMVAIFAVRIKNSPGREKKEKAPKSTKVSATKEEKIEVACPTCDRRLRVPDTYSGAVRCPECETKFDVEAKVETSIPEEKQHTAEKLSPAEDLFSSSDNDILGCPKCTRKLKVPYDKRPAKARCPACSTIFEARKK